MVRYSNDRGTIIISGDVITTLVGSAATNCFGVKGMAARSTTDGLVHLLRREAMGKGVLVEYNEDGTVSIDLHIIIDNGVNINALSQSIIEQVKYKTALYTGVEIKAVNVYVDSIMVD